MTDPRLRTIRTLLCLGLGCLFFGVGWLWAGLGFTALGLFMPVFAGGCATFCSPSYSGDFQVDIALIANNTCSSCDSANGTFILPFNSVVSGAVTCQWNDPVTTTVCGEVYSPILTIFKQAFGTKYFVQLSLPDLEGTSSEVCISTWLSDEGTTVPNCGSFSSKSLPAFFNTNGQCNCASATVEVTAI